MSRIFLPTLYVPFALAIFVTSRFLLSRGAIKDVWGAFDLTLFRLAAFLLVVMVAGSVLQAVRSRRERGVLPLLTGLAALAVVVSGLGLSLYRFEGTLIMGEGEAYEPVAPAFSEIRKGPLARVPAPVFVMASISGDLPEPAFSIIPGAGGHTLTSEKGTLKTAGVDIQLMKSALMPLIQLTAVNGGILAREFVRLDPDTVMRQDSFMFVNNPYDFIVRQIKGSGKDEGPALHVAARRGKLKIAEGRLDMKTSLKVDAFTVSMPETKRSGIFRISRRPGNVLFKLSGALFLGLYAVELFLGSRNLNTATREH